MKAQIIFNPTAGQRDTRRELAQVIKYLESCGWQVTLKGTRGPGDARVFARQAVDAGCEVVIVAGGDGTINETLGELAGSEAALGVLPIGTANIWALEVGIPVSTPLQHRHLLEAARILVEGERRAIDLGQAGQRYFLLMAGIGIDAQVTETVEPRTKRKLGVLAYLWAGLIAAKDFVGTRVTITVDGLEIEATVILITISNTRLYALMPIAPQRRLDDGLLDVCVFTGQGCLATVRHFLSVALRRHLRDPQVLRYQAKQVRVEAAKPLPVQVDAEPIGTTPMEFVVVPRALQAIVPRDVPLDLFVSPDR